MIKKGDKIKREDGSLIAIANRYLRSGQVMAFDDFLTPEGNIFPEGQRMSEEDFKRVLKALGGNNA
jgi:hypothetical protein